MDEKIINAFKSSIGNVFSQLGIDYKFGGVSVKKFPYTMGDILIQIGVVGDYRGQLMTTMKTPAFKKISSAMLGGMEASTEVEVSALAELMNMISGGACTIISADNGIIDITPPAALMGDNLQLSSKGTLLSLKYTSESSPEDVYEVQFDMIFE